MMLIEKRKSVVGGKADRIKTLSAYGTGNQARKQKEME